MTLRTSGTLTILVVVGCAAPGARIDRRVPSPGYRCTIEESGEFGGISADIEIEDSNPRPHGLITWNARPDFPQSRITGAWLTRGNKFTIDNGYLSLQMLNGAIASKISVELRAASEPSTIGGSRLASGPSGSSDTVNADWNDVAAMARGTTQLYLLARDKKGRIFNRVAIESRLFVRAERPIAIAIEKANQMIADPARLCTRVEDLRDDEIIIT